MIRLVIADDHPIFREGLRRIVSENPDMTVVGDAADAEGTIRACVSQRPDVLLVDVTMPGPGILELIRMLKALQPTPRLLVLSMHPEEEYARRVLQEGADGYLTKSSALEALAVAIRQVYAGRTYVSPTLAEALAHDLVAPPVVPHERLSNREYEVLRLLGSGKRVEEIATRMRVSTNTVRTYRARILEKLELNGTAEIMFYAIRHGLVHPDSPAQKGCRRPRKDRG